MLALVWAELEIMLEAGLVPGTMFKSARSTPVPPCRFVRIRGEAVAGQLISTTRVGAVLPVAL